MRGRRLLPHALTNLFAATIAVSGVRADRAWKRAGVRPPGRPKRVSVADADTEQGSCPGSQARSATTRGNKARGTE